MSKIITLLLVIFFLFGASSAEAHRDGCHRWHSCPSDSGSYVCGDLGYTSQCGGAQAPVEAQEEPTVEYIQPTAKPTYRPLPTKKATPTKKPTINPVANYVETENDKKKFFKVVNVVDGDTIDVLIRGKKERVRLLAIDTPETKDPRKPVQCFGYEATNKLKELVTGKFVKLVDDKSQGNKDSFKRLLRYIYLENGEFINADMVKDGYAFSYKKYPTKYLNDFNNLEKMAREKNLGLWNKCK